jgi:hypothetical protein
MTLTRSGSSKNIEKDKIKLSRCAFFVEKCIPFTNSALYGPSEAPNQKWHKISCT